MYEFADDAGSMERSRYFGFSKGAHQPGATATQPPWQHTTFSPPFAPADLYHQDHFIHGLNQACPALINCTAFTLLDGPPGAPPSQQQQQELEPLPPGMEAVLVSVVDSTGAPGGVFELRLVQREAGLKQGCWMTKSCIRVQAP
jgi:hypothetical protein